MEILFTFEKETSDLGDLTKFLDEIFALVKSYPTNEIIGFGLGHKLAIPIETYGFINLENSIHISEIQRKLKGIATKVRESQISELSGIWGRCHLVFASIPDFMANTQFHLAQILAHIQPYLNKK